MFKKLFVIACFTLLLFSCNVQKKNPVVTPLEYLEGAEKFDIKEFFNQTSYGFAIALDRNGKIISKHSVTSIGSWDGNKGTVKFDFLYSKEKKDFRTWLVTIDDEKNFTIVGHDFLEPAKGRQSGNVSEIIYKMNIDFNNAKNEYKFTDNIFQVDNKSAIIITEVSDEKGVIGKIITSVSKSEAKKVSVSIPKGGEKTSPKKNDTNNEYDDANSSTRG